MKQVARLTRMTFVLVWLNLGASNPSVALGQVTIDSNTVIDASFPNSVIEVIDGANPPTVVDVVEGGYVGNGSSIRGSSIVNVSGGYMDWSQLFDTATVNLSAGGVGDEEEEPVTALQNSAINMSGGRLTAVEIRDSAELTITGGRVTSEEEATAISVRDTGSVNISAVDYNAGDDDKHFLIARGNSTVDISGATVQIFEADFINVLDSATLTISGGTYRVLEGTPIDALDFSTVIVSGGEFFTDDYSSIVARNDSTVRISGGRFEGYNPNVSASDMAKVRIEGGSIESLAAGGFSVIEIHGENLALSDGRLTGVLADGTPIDAEAVTGGSGQILLVPEPSTFVFAIAGFLIFAVLRQPP